MVAVFKDSQQSNNQAGASINIKPDTGAFIYVSTQ